MQLGFAVFVFSRKQRCSLVGKVFLHVIKGEFLCVRAASSATFRASTSAQIIPETFITLEPTDITQKAHSCCWLLIMNGAHGNREASELGYNLVSWRPSPLSDFGSFTPRTAVAFPQAVGGRPKMCAPLAPTQNRFIDSIVFRLQLNPLLLQQTSHIVSGVSQHLCFSLRVAPPAPGAWRSRPTLHALEFCAPVRMPETRALPQSAETSRRNFRTQTTTTTLRCNPVSFGLVVCLRFRFHFILVRQENSLRLGVSHLFALSK